MKRRTLDLLFSIGGMGLAILLVVVGAVLTSNANFAKNYVADQLKAQKVTFKTAATLTPEEQKSACLVKYAGKALVTGKMAECYANDFIGLHTSTLAAGETYATIGDKQSALRTQVADATKTNAATLPALQKQLVDITATRETLFKGETLRGLLLTSFGFSVFGVKAGQMSSVAYMLGGLLLLLSLAGLYHAARTPKSQLVGAPDYYEDIEDKLLAKV
jgi:hypothetical protein